MKKTTWASIGDGSSVNALGYGAGLAVNTGSYQVTIIDTRFDPGSAIEGDDNTIDLGYQDGLADGSRWSTTTVAAPITRPHRRHVLRPRVSDHEVRCPRPSQRLAGTLTISGGSGRVAAARPDAAGRRRPGRQDAALRPADGRERQLDHAAVRRSSSVSTGDPLVYSSGGGTPIGGLVDGGTYYVIGSGTQPVPARATRASGRRPVRRNGNPLPSRRTLARLAGDRKSHSLVNQGDKRRPTPRVIGPRQIAQTETRLPRRGGDCDEQRRHRGCRRIAAVGGGVSVAVGGTVDDHHGRHDRDHRQGHEDQRPEPRRRTRASPCSSQPAMPSTCSSSPPRSAPARSASAQA